MTAEQDSYKKRDDTAKRIAEQYRRIRAEYLFDTDILNEDDELVRAVKYLLTTQLNTVEKTLLILYAECGCYRKMEEILHISHTSCAKLLKPIIERIRNDEHICRIVAGRCGRGLRY